MNSSQAQFETDGKAPSQTSRFITALMEANGQFVGLPALVEAIGGFAVHSRAADARKMGYNIENHTVLNRETGKRMSFYRVIP